MRGGKTITHARKSHNLFTLDFVGPSRIISAINKAIVITGRGQSTLLIIKKKCICLWHLQLAHVSNVQIVKAFKLIKSIDLGPQKNMTQQKYL